MKPYPARVTWLDAHQVFNGWDELENIDSTPCEVQSVGWLIPGSKKDHIVLVLSIARELGHYDSGLAIPKNMVTKIEKLTPPARGSKPR